VDFIAQRTSQKFASFSWKNKIMGMLIPLRDGHEGNPEFTVPIPNGLVGSFELSPPTDAKVTVLEKSWKKTPDGFETAGTLLLNGGRLKQTLALTSIGDQTVVYQDRVTALSDVTVRRERGVPVGIENDEITGGRRLVSHRDAAMEFDWQKAQRPVALAGPWCNVDGRLGVIMLSGSGMAYAQASGYSPGISVGTDILYASCSDGIQQFKAGEVVAHCIVVFFVEVAPNETAALARSCRIEAEAGRQVLRLKHPDGKASAVALL
jgi:hypothetical protein